MFARPPRAEMFFLARVASVAGNRTDLNERFSENEHELAVPKCVPLAMQIAQSTIDTNGCNAILAIPNGTRTKYLSPNMRIFKRATIGIGMPTHCT